MFGMSSIDFWENEPQLYWAYRFSYLKEQEINQKIETQKMRLTCWLQGKINEIAFEVALNNSLSKKKIDFPTFEKMFENQILNESKAYKELSEKLENVEDKDVRQQIEFNYWARLKKGE